MTNATDELRECTTDEVALRLIGVIERLLDENERLMGGFINYPYNPYRVVTMPTVTTPTVTWGPNDVTCDVGVDA